MKTNCFKYCALFAVASSAGVVAHQALAAQHTDDWEYEFNKRLYVGVGGGVTTLTPDTLALGPNVQEDDEDSGVHGFLGWDFSRRLSLELQYADLGVAKLTQNRFIEYEETSLAAIFYAWNNRGDDGYSDLDGFDTRTGISVYGRFGVGQMENTANVNFVRENDVQLLFGIGAEYGMENGFALRGEYTSYDKDAKFAGLSLLYRFGSVKPLGRPDDGQYELPTLPAPEAQAPLPPPPPVNDVPKPMAPADQMMAAKDADGDGVTDQVDDCPGSRSGAVVNQYGCEAFGGVLEGVNFLSGSDTLTREAREVLTGVARTMMSAPDMRVSVEAHTDGAGAPRSNLELSRRRALAVVRFLTAQGVPLNRFEARAFGESRPIASDETAEGRQMNRRVEINPLR